MNSYETFSQPKGSTRWLLWSLILIFLTTLTTFTILEIRSLNDEEPSVIRIILNNIKRQGKTEPNLHSNKFVLVNLEDVEEEKEDLVKAIVTQVEQELPNSELERKTRGVGESAKNNSYYEEQTPVVVYSKSDQEAPLSYRQAAPVPYQQHGGSHDEQPYMDGEYNGDYANDDPAYYRPQYDDDSREDFPGPQDYANEGDSAEGRSAQNRQYDSYYRQWHYATPSPASATSKQSSQANRKLQTMTGAAAATGDSR